MSDAQAPVAPPSPVQHTRVAAYAVCRDDDARILLVRIGPRDPEPGSWTLPGGGLDFGEDPRTGVLRELDEETGLNGEILNLAGVDSRYYEPALTRSGRAVHAIRIVYRVRVTGGTLRDEIGGSTDRAAWIAPDDLSRLPIVDLVTAALAF